MSVDVTSIRLPEKDSSEIDRLVVSGHFRSRSDFIRYAVKRTINEMLLRDIQAGLSSDEISTSHDEVLCEIREIRRKLWDEYAEDLS